MGPLTWLLWRQHVSRGRVLAIGAVGAMVVLLAVAILLGDGGAQAARQLVEEAGLALLVPVTAAVFATSVLGDPAEDGTLGYLLTTPQPRWRVAVPGLVATSMVVVPLAVTPLVVALALNDVPGRTTLATAVGGLLAALAYCGVFTALGVRIRRGLLVGLLYTAIWEGVVARFGTGLARLSIRQYALSAIDGLRGVHPPTDGVTGTTAIVVLAALAVGGAALTTWFLRVHESRA